MISGGGGGRCKKIHYLLVKTKLFFSLQFFLIGHGFESELSESEIAGQSLR